MQRKLILKAAFGGLAVAGGTFLMAAAALVDTQAQQFSTTGPAAIPGGGAGLQASSPGAGPSIIANPEDVAVFAGLPATFSVSVELPPSTTLVRIEWLKNGANISNGNGLTVTFVAMPADDGAVVKAVVTTSSGVLTSTEATLTVATFANEFVPGVVKFEAYHDILGTSVDSLFADVKFPSRPDNARLLTGLDTPNGYGDNYGARVSGFIIPQETASYHLFIRSDAASAFYLSSTETPPDPTTATPFCEETQCCAEFQEPADPSPEQTSAEPIALVQGKKYAFVAILKGATGDDYLQVAVRKVGDTTPAAILRPLGGAWVGANAKPNKGTPQITRQPVGIPQLLQGRSASLSIEASIIPAAFLFPMQVQWNLDGRRLEGATSLTYKIESATESSEGIYTAIVTAPSGEFVVSDPAVVTYLPDTFAPGIRGVTANSLSSLIVSFDESVDAATAGDLTNYSLSDGVVISSATVSGGSVLLTTSNLTPGKSYVLTVSNVKDLFGNTIPEGTTHVFTVKVVTYDDIVLSDGPVLFYTFEETSGQRTRNLGTEGASADGLWKAGNDALNSVAVDVSTGSGPRPGEFIGFSPDNHSGLFAGPSRLLWVDAQKQLLNNLSAFSMEFWMKATNRVTDPGVVDTRIGIVGQNAAIASGFPQRTIFQTATASGGTLNTPYSFPAGEWHHVATVGDGSSIQIYFDGVLVNQIKRTTANYGSSAFTVHVGGGGVLDASGNHFTGEIDAVALYNKALSEKRVAAHFKAGKEGGQIPGVDPVIRGITLQSTGVLIRYDGLLQAAGTVGGLYVPVAGSPAGEGQTFTVPISVKAQYFRAASE